MSWDTTMVTMLRYLINDLSDTPTYTDARLKQLLAVAAQYTLDDVAFKQVYTIDIETPSISPDPTDGDKDNAFMNLVTLKAACLFDNWNLITKTAIGGISVRSGSDSVSNTGNTQGYQWILQNGACKGYEQAKWEFEAGNLIPGKAILGPFAGWNIDTDGYNNYKRQ